MKFVFPIKYGEKIFTDVEIKRPNADTLSMTSEFIEDSKYFYALWYFVSYCITEIQGTETITDREQINRITRQMMYKALYHTSIQILLLNNPDDGIEGFYNCPRCGKDIVAEYSDGIDSRDFISQLELNYFEGEPLFNIALDTSVELKTSNIDSEIINNIGFGYPTITDYIEAEAKHSLKFSSRLQMEVYAKNILTVNGKEIDKRWKNNFSNLLIKKMSGEDLSKVAREINKIGLNPNVKKVCGKCGKEFEVEVNTNNFFVFGLRAKT